MALASCSADSSGPAVWAPPLNRLPAAHGCQMLTPCPALPCCRSQEDVKRSMQLKDAMRETCIGRVADTWISLVAGLQSSSPTLAAMVLLTMQRFINWIDISLVANDR